MAKTFGQYTGGIQAIQGINEFGAQQAAGIERTMGGLASTITKTYDTLNQQEEENSANKELVKGQSGNLAAIKKLMDANPDTKDSPLSQSITEMIAKLDSAGDLNRGQLKGLLKSSEVFTSQLPLTMQLQDKAFLAQTTAGVNSALAALKKQTVKDSKGYDVPVPSFQGGSPEKYQRDLKTFFEQHKTDNPEVQLDIDKAVRDSVQLQIQRFTNDPDLKKADPTYQQHLIRGFEALGKMDKTSTDWTSPDTPETGDANAYQLATTAPADIRRGEIAAQALEAQRKAGTLPPVAGAPQFDANGLDANGFDKNGMRPITAQKRYEDATKHLGSEKTKAETSVADLTKELADTSQRMADMVLKQGKGGTAEHKKAVERYEEIKNTLLPDAKQAVKDTSSAVTEHAKDKEGFLKRWTEPKSLEELAADQTNDETVINNKVTAEALKQKEQVVADLLARVKKGEHIGLGDRLGHMSPFGTGSQLWTNIDNEVLSNRKTAFGKDIGSLVDKLNENGQWHGETGYRTFRNATDKLVTPHSQDLEKFIGELRGVQDAGFIETDAGVRPANRLATQKLLEQKLASVREEIKASKSAPLSATPATETAKANALVAGVSASEPATPEAPKPDMYAMGFDYKMTIPGVFVNERPLTYDEEREGVRKWFEENHNGVVPTTIDSIYKTIRPEAALKFAKGPNGENLMHTDKGWTQMTQLTAPKGMTSEEKSDEGLYNFGQIVNGRRIPAEARTGSGIMVSGFFSGGKKRAEEFNQALTDTATLVESVPELVDMFKKTGHSIKLLNQEEQGRALSLLVKIRAAIRVETIGTGPIAIAEHKMLMDRLGDPNALFTLDKHEISKLQSILDTSKSQLQRTGVGVNITYRPAHKAGANPVQQNKLDNRINQGSK